MKKRLRLKKVTLRNLDDAATSRMAGGVDTTDGVLNCTACATAMCTEATCPYTVCGCTVNFTNCSTCNNCTDTCTGCPTS